jgi:hypothetical protein
MGASLVLSIVRLNPSSDPDKVPTPVLHHFAELYCPLIILLQGAAILTLLGYKITRSSHEETLTQLAAEAELAQEVA